MSTLKDRSTALALTQKPRRVSTSDWAGMTVLAVLAAALVSGKIAQSEFAKEIIAGISPEVQLLDQHWRHARNWIGFHRSSTTGRLECVSDPDPYREARAIAARIESGARVFVGCAQVRIASE